MTEAQNLSNALRHAFGAPACEPLPGETTHVAPKPERHVAGPDIRPISEALRMAFAGTSD